MSSVCYPIPIEWAQRGISPAGIAALVDMALAGARYQPLAMLRILNGAWVVRFEFMEPITTPDGPKDCLQLTSTIHPEGGLG